MTTQVLLNERCLTRPMTGVDRVAIELTNTLSANPRFSQSYNLRRLRPSYSPLRRFGAGHVWEQLYLARHAPEAPLLSFCNTGPILRRNQIVMFHDAQVHSCPQSYNPLFRAAYQTLQPILGRIARTVVTVSNHSKSELERFGIVPAGKAIVLHNGADHILRPQPEHGVLQRYQLQPNGYFLTFCAGGKHKNLATLKRALTQRTGRRLPLVMVGGETPQSLSGPHDDQVGQCLRIGRVPDGALRALYENATALLFPSWTEGFGLPVAEAMMCGCPVVATTGGALPEVCGSATLLRAPNDDMGWAKAMDQLANDPALRENLSAAGYRRVARFTWAAAAERLTTILEQHQADPIAANPLGAA